jgi:hypothetical protein
LLYDIWRILEGDQREEVFLDDLRILIMAILKIPYPNRIGVQPTDEEKETLLVAGFFNSKN